MPNWAVFFFTPRPRLFKWEVPLFGRSSLFYHFLGVTPMIRSSGLGFRYPYTIRTIRIGLSKIGAPQKFDFSPSRMGLSMFVLK